MLFRKAVLGRTWMGVISACIGAPALAAVFPGAVPGAFAVGEQGDASYTIPIETPAATGGLKPSLALRYNHLAGNGLAGMRWTLTGFSAITRCQRTYAQDTVGAAVNYTATDRLCLDGQRLVEYAGSYWADGTEYRTEIDGFQRIIQVFSGNAAYFYVQHGNGLTSYYGVDSDSRIEKVGSSATRLWYLSFTEDPYGNRISYQYSEDATTGEVYPSGVTWTANASQGLSARYQVAIVMETAPAEAQRFGYEQGGAKTARTKRIDRIDVLLDSVAVRTYNLSYKTPSSSGTQRSQLEKVTLCRGVDCVPDTVFTVQEGASGWSSQVYSGQEAGYSPRVGDFNNDGKQDLFVSVPSRWRVYLGQANGSFGAPIESPYSWGNDTSTARVVDYNGDGMADLFYEDGPNWYVLQSTGTGFQQVFVTAKADLPAPAFQDFDGDGLQDALWVSGASTYWRRNTGGSLAAAQLLYTEPYAITGYFSFSTHAGSLDANGDGRADMVTASANCVQNFPEPTCYNLYNLLLASGSTYSAVTIDATAQGDPLGNFRAIDINGDGLDDLLYTQGGAWKFLMSTGNSLTAGGATTISTSGAVLVADYDSDGRGDLIRQDGNYWRIHRSTGSTLSPSVTESLSSPFGYTPFAVDVTGDGFPEIVQNTLINGNGYWHTHKHQSALPDVVTAVVDGLGYRVDVNYHSLSNSPNYTVSTEMPPAPYVRKFSGARYVVVQEAHDDGIGGKRTFDHHYRTAWIETTGRGSFSFYRHINYDLATGTHTQTYYHQVFPYFGLVSWSGLMRSSDGQVARAVLPTMSQSVWPSSTPARRFVRVEYSMTFEYEVGGPVSGTYLRRVEQNPEYETTYGRLLSTATETYQIGNGAHWTSYTTFDPQTPEASWCLDRRGLVTTTNTLFDRVTSAQRKVRYAWSGCQLATVTDESETGVAAKQLRTTFTSYDGFGNPNVVTRDSVAGTGEPRTVDYDFDQWGQFPTKETVGTVNLATEFTWDYATGQRASVKPPDGLTTSWQFDAFGRVSGESGPGPDTTITYSACSGSCWAPHAVYYSRAQMTAGGDDYEFFDELNRSVGRSWKLPLGNEGRQSTLYNAAGRVDSVAKPYVYGQQVFATGFSYDSIGRLTQQDEPISESQPSGAHTDYHYEGMTTRVVRNGEQTQYLYDARRQIRQVTDHLGSYTIYGYRPFGELWTVTDAEGHLSTVTYDLRGHKTQLADPNMGTWVYEHNVFGELIRQKSPVTTSSACGTGGTWTVCLDYDAAGRIESRAEAEGATTWSYHASGVGQKGRLYEVTGPGHALRYSYSSVHGLPTEVRHTLDGVSYFYNFQYQDSLARLDVLTYPESTTGYRFKVDYDYDAYGHLTVAKDGASPFAPFYTLTEADARGREVTVELGSGASRLYEQWGYDLATGRLDFVRTGTGGYGSTQIQDLAFTFDEVGNLLTRTNGKIGRTETFTYALDRLESAQVSGGGALIDPTYSAAGRILSKSDVGAYSYTGGCGGGPYAVKSAGGQSFCYDASGRMTSRAGQAIDWRSYDLPSVLRAAGNQSAELSYGVDRARYKQVKKTGSTVDATLLYIGGLLEKETAGGTTTWRHYVSARGRTVAQVLRTGSTNTVQYLHRDHQGSVVEVTNASGSLVQSLAFDAWGLRRNPANWLPLASPFAGAQPTERGYTGHEHLDTVELVHMNGRVQDPKLGLFISADPIVQSSYHSQSLNRYSYVWNNPMSLVDPSGFQTEEYNPWDDPNHPTDIDYAASAVKSWAMRDHAASVQQIFVEFGRHVSEVTAGLPGYWPQYGLVTSCSDGWCVTSRSELPRIAQLHAQLTGAGPPDDRAIPSFIRGFRGEMGSLLDANRPYAEDVGQAVREYGGVAIEGALLGTGVAAVVRYGAASLIAARGTTTVIGRTKDLGNLAKGERSLLDRLTPDLGSAKANWARNSGVLREEMRRGLPIRDASPGDTAGTFLNAERALLRDRGWTFDPATNYWMPPVP